MADRYLIETSGVDGYLLEDGTGVLLLETSGAATAPIVQTDWPNPRGSSQSGYTVFSVNLILTLLSPIVFRAPLIAPRIVPQAPHVGFVQSRPSTLATPVTPPFDQIDWPNPVRPIHNVALDTWIDPLKINLRGQDTIYGSPGQVSDYAWPNPSSPQSTVHVQTVGTNLQGTTLSQLRPFTPVPWPNPRGPIPGINQWIDPLKLNLLGQDRIYGGSGQVPVYNWPNPQGTQGTAHLAFTNIQGVVPSPTASPFIPIDWANPRGYQVSIDLRQWTTNLQLSTLSTPLRPKDWPNPSIASPVISLRTWLDPVRLNLLGQDTFFGGVGQPPAQLDWPNPRGPAFPISLRQWDNNLLTTTFGQIVQGPFGQIDWPNPKGPGFHLPTWLQAVPLNLQGQDTIFGARGQVPVFDWQNPRGPIYPISLRTWEVGNLNGTLRFQASPIAQLNWPNPRGPIPPIVLQTWADSLRLPLNVIPAVLPFSTRDWPNPKGSVYQAALQQWAINRPRDPAAPPVVQPFRQIVRIPQSWNTLGRWSR